MAAAPRKPSVEADPWAEPAAGAPASTRAAALWLWGIALGEVLLLTCFAAAIASMATLPAEEIDRQFTDPAVREQVEAFRQNPGATVTVLLATTGVHALLLAACGVGVRLGRRWVVWAGLVLLGMQMAMSVLWVVLTVVQAAVLGRPAEMTMGVLMGGTVALVLGGALRALWPLRGGVAMARRGATQDTDPWNS